MTTRLQFGKYAGYDIAIVPVEYLEWLQQSTKKTLDMLDAELERRRSIEAASESMAVQVIRVGFRELSKRHHPDMGGDGAKMRELIGAYHQLQELVEHEFEH